MRASTVKSILIAALAATGFAAGSAVAGPMRDTFLGAYDSANSGDGTELGFFADAAKQGFANVAVEKSVGQNGAAYDQEAGLWVIDLDVELAKAPGYFLLKFGLPKLEDELIENTVVEEDHGKGGGKGGKVEKVAKENKFITGLDTYIFQNIGDMQQLVWSNADVNYLTGGVCTTSGKTGPCNIERLSHISYIVLPDGTGGTGGGEVPEPASLALLGAGLAGMALRRRRG